MRCFLEGALQGPSGPGGSQGWGESWVDVSSPRQLWPRWSDTCSPKSNGGSPRVQQMWEIWVRARQTHR